MVSAQMLVMMDTRLRQLLVSDALFGGCGVLLCGDFYQLPPVCDLPIHDNTPVSPCRVPGTSTHLFYSYFQLHALTKSVRHQTDPAWGEFLLRLRVGFNGEDEVQDAIQYLSARLLDDDTKRHNSARSTRLQAELDVDPAWQHATVIHGRNRDVAALNERRLCQVARNTQVPIFSIRAVDVPESGKGTMAHVAGQQERTAAGWTDLLADAPSFADGGALAPVVWLCVGARVMLRHNIAVHDHLYNGAEGIVVAIDFPEPVDPHDDSGDDSTACTVNINHDAASATVSNIPDVWVHFFGKVTGAGYADGVRLVHLVSPHVAAACQVQPGSVVLALCIKPRTAKCEPLPAKRNAPVKRFDQLRFTRTQLPIVLSWALTVHKVRDVNI